MRFISLTKTSWYSVKNKPAIANDYPFLHLLDFLVQKLKFEANIITYCTGKYENHQLLKIQKFFIYIGEKFQSKFAKTEIISANIITYCTEKCENHWLLKIQKFFIYIGEKNFVKYKFSLSKIEGGKGGYLVANTIR